MPYIALTFHWPPSHPYSHVIDPMEWSTAHVMHWIKWAVPKFYLEEVILSNFGSMNGEQLCMLKHQDFMHLIPNDHGDKFWTHLELLKRCKFVG